MKLFIAIPSYKFIDITPVHCMFALLSSDPEHQRTLALHGGEGFVGRSRNQICSKFLEDPAEYSKLLMIDSDILYTDEQVNRISSHVGKGIVCGFYAKKAQGKPVWVANRTSKGGPLSTGADENGLVQVETIGTGFMCVDREVLEKMRDSRVAKRYVVDGTDIVEYEFFPFRVVNERLRSEDWAFCDNAYECGYTVYGDTQCVLKHIGTAIYPLDAEVKLERLGKAIKDLQHRGIYVPPEIFKAIDLDPSYNVSEIPPAYVSSK